MTKKEFLTGIQEICDNFERSLPHHRITTLWYSYVAKITKEEWVRAVKTIIKYEDRYPSNMTKTVRDIAYQPKDRKKEERPEYTSEGMVSTRDVIDGIKVKLDHREEEVPF